MQLILGYLQLVSLPPTFAILVVRSNRSFHAHTCFVPFLPMLDTTLLHPPPDRSIWQQCDGTVQRIALAASVVAFDQQPHSNPLAATISADYVHIFQYSLAFILKENVVCREGPFRHVDVLLLVPYQLC